MSATLRAAHDIENDGSHNVAICEIFADTAADLAGLDHLEDVYFLQGSEATDIDTGDKYLMQSNGTWKKQPTGSAFENVYTKTEMDAIINQIEAGQYLHDSTQVNFDSVTWSRSGGGLYYSSTIQIPDSPITKIYHATLSGFANLRATDMIIPAVRRSGAWSGFVLYANTNLFLPGAWVTVSVSGVA